MTKQERLQAGCQLSLSSDEDEDDDDEVEEEEMGEQLGGELTNNGKLRKE